MPTYICNDGNAPIEIEAATAKAAAQEYVDGGSWGDRTHTDWIDVYVEEIQGEDGERILGDRECITITLEAQEPRCEDEQEHDWQSPHELLGGDKHNPGVHGKGGGVVIREVCAHCGRYRVTDTWAQRMDNGQQGLTEISYEDADEDSLNWIREGAES